MGGKTSQPAPLPATSCEKITIQTFRHLLAQRLRRDPTPRHWQDERRADSQSSRSSNSSAKIARGRKRRQHGLQHRLRYRFALPLPWLVCSASTSRHLLNKIKSTLRTAKIRQFQHGIGVDDAYQGLHRRSRALWLSSAYPEALRHWSRKTLQQALVVALPCSRIGIHMRMTRHSRSATSDKKLTFNALGSGSETL